MVSYSTWDMMMMNAVRATTRPARFMAAGRGYLLRVWPRFLSISFNMADSLLWFICKFVFKSCAIYCNVLIIR